MRKKCEILLTTICIFFVMMQCYPLYVSAATWQERETNAISFREENWKDGEYNINKNLYKEQVEARLARLMELFPSGKYWNHDSSYTGNNDWTQITDNYCDYDRDAHNNKDTYANSCNTKI